MHISSIYPILGAALLAGFQVSLAQSMDVHDESSFRVSARASHLDQDAQLRGVG